MGLGVGSGVGALLGDDVGCFEGEPEGCHKNFADNTSFEMHKTHRVFHSVQ